MEYQVLERAIRQAKVISFQYRLHDAPRFQIVEPHQMTRSSDGEVVLRAWLLDGWSQAGKGWVEYPLRQIADVSVLPNRFLPRTAAMPTADSIPA